MSNRPRIDICYGVVLADLIRRRGNFDEAIKCLEEIYIRALTVRAEILREKDNG